MSRGAVYAGKAAILITIDDAVDKGLMLVRNKLRKFANGIGGLGSSMLRVGVLGSIGSGFMLKQFINFSDELLNLQAKLGYFGKMTAQQTADMDMLTKTIRDLGRSTSFTSKEVASAATELAQAGFSVKEINSSLQATLDLARGTNYGLAESAAMMANAIRTFNLDTKQANQVVSMFVRAARLGTLGIEDLRESLKYVSGTAMSLDQTLPSVLGFLVQLSETGMKASISGSSLNVEMLNLINNLEKIQAVYPTFSLQHSQDGAFDFLNTMKKLYTVTANLSSVDRTKFFQDIFNIRGGRSAMGTREIHQVEKFIKEISNAGNEAELASKTMDSKIGGAFRRAASALDDLNITIQEIAENSFKGIIEAVAPFAEIIDKLAKKFPKVVTGLLMMPFALAGAAAGFLTLHVAIRRAADGLSVFLGLWRKTGGGLTMLTARQMGAIGFGRFGGLLGRGGDRTGTRTMAQNFRRGGLFLQARNIGRVFEGVGQIFSARRGIGTTASTTRLVLGLRNLGRGLRGLASGLFTVVRGITRFTFSWTGFFTALELLVLFGHKVPFIADGFKRLGNGFKGFFKEIGRIGGLFTGPAKLFFSAIGILSEGNGVNAELGLEYAVKSLELMASVISNQLIAAWNQLVYAVAPVYDFLRKILATVYEITAVSLGSLFDVIGGRLTPFTQIFSKLFGDTDTGSWNDFFARAAKMIAWFNVSFIGVIDKLANVFDSFLYELQKRIIELNYVSGGYGVGKQARLDKESNLLGARAEFDLQDQQYKNRLAKRDIGLKKIYGDIDKIFSKDTAANSLKNYNKARANSNNASQSSFALLEEMYARNAALMQAEAMKQTANSMGGFPSGPGKPGAMQQMKQQMQWISAIAFAVSGSASSTRGNLLQTAVSTEEYLKKLDHLEPMDNSLKDINKKMDDGGFL